MSMMAISNCHLQDCVFSFCFPNLLILVVNLPNQGGILPNKLNCHLLDCGFGFFLTSF